MCHIYSISPTPRQILFAPLTGLEVVGQPRVEGKSIVVELRLNTNLHDLTIEQVIAKMKKTHQDLIHTIEMDMLMEGFSVDSLAPLEKHKKGYEEKNGSWFNNSDNYKSITNQAIDAKLDVCCDVLKSATAPGEERALAAKVLFNADDAAALAKGIATILPDASLLKTYGPELERIAATGSHLGTLDLKDEGLTGELPASVMQLMGSAEYFNLHGNSFSNVNEGTALHNMVYGMTNWRDRKELVWSGQNGGGKFASLPNEIRLFVSLVTLDLSANDGLTSKFYERALCSTHATISDVITVSALPKEIGNLSELQTLILEDFDSLQSK